MENLAKRAKERRQAVAVALAVLGGAGAVVIGALAIWLWPANTASLLTAAREQLDVAARETEPTRRRAAAFAAIGLLEKSGAQGRAADATSQLLLAAAYSVESESGTSAGERLRQVERLRKTVDLSRVATADIALAADLLLARHPQLAEFLIAKALARSDERTLVLQTACRVRYYLARDDQALSHARELIELAPNDQEAWEVLAAVFENRGNSDQLIGIYRKRLEIEPASSQVLRTRLVRHLIKTGEVDEARREFNLLKAEPDHADFLLLSAQLLEVEGNTAAALDDLDRALLVRQDDPQLLLVRGRIRLSRGDLALAKESLVNSIRADPYENEAHHLLGQVFARCQEPELAKKHLDEHRRLLDTRVKLHKMEQEAVARPGDAALRREIAALYRSIGLTEKSEFWDRSVAGPSAFNP